MKKKHFYIRRKFVTFVCLALLGVFWIVGVRAQQISVANWAIEIVAQLAPDSLSVYLTAKDSMETGSIIEVPMSPYIKGLSSIVLCGEEQAIGFIAGKLSSPGNRLIVIHIKMQNTEKDTKSLRVGDISLKDNDGRNLPYVAVSKNNSYLIAKTSIVAWRSSQEIVLSVEPDEKVKITYCFIVPSSSFPVELKYKNTKALLITDLDALPLYKRESPGIMELGGTFNLPVNIETISTDVSFNNQDADIQFKSDVGKYSEGDIFAAYVSSFGARSAYKKEIIEKLNGKEKTRSLKVFYIFKGGFYRLGTITFMVDIDPLNIETNFGDPKLHTIFKSTFKAKKGDILAAVRQVRLFDYILSVHTME